MNKENNNNNKIESFRNEYFFLSNMFKCSIIFKTKFTDDYFVFDSSEHIYQSYKAQNVVDFNLVANSRTPLMSKRNGSMIQIDPDFSNYKLNLMYRIIKAKFKQNENLKDLLIRTGDKKLIEDNYWGDKFWGVCDGFGENNLGKILTEVRRECKYEEK